MNDKRSEHEAIELLDNLTDAVERFSYEELLSRFAGEGEQWTQLYRGQEYQIEVQSFIESRRKGRLRVIVSVDGGVVPQRRPITGSFLVDRPAAD